MFNLNFLISVVKSKGIFVNSRKLFRLFKGAFIVEQIQDLIKKIEQKKMSKIDGILRTLNSQFATNKLLYVLAFRSCSNSFEVKFPK